MPDQLLICLWKLQQVFGSIGTKVPNAPQDFVLSPVLIGLRSFSVLLKSSNLRTSFLGEEFSSKTDSHVTVISYRKNERLKC